MPFDRVRELLERERARLAGRSFLERLDDPTKDFNVREEHELRQAATQSLRALYQRLRRRAPYHVVGERFGHPDRQSGHQPMSGRSA